MRKTLAQATVLGTLALAVAGCSETPAQEEVNDQAEAIAESYDAQADLVEAQAENGPNEAIAEEKADALREEGEQIEDHLKDMADEDL